MHNFKRGDRVRILKSKSCMSFFEKNDIAIVIAIGGDRIVSEINPITNQRLRSFYVHSNVNHVYLVSENPKLEYLNVVNYVDSTDIEYLNEDNKSHMPKWF